MFHLEEESGRYKESYRVSKDGTYSTESNGMTKRVYKNGAIEWTNAEGQKKTIFPNGTIIHNSGEFKPKDPNIAAIELVPNDPNMTKYNSQAKARAELFFNNGKIYINDPTFKAPLTATGNKKVHFVMDDDGRIFGFNAPPGKGPGYRQDQYWALLDDGKNAISVGTFELDPQGKILTVTPDTDAVVRTNNFEVKKAVQFSSINAVSAKLKDFGLTFKTSDIPNFNNSNTPRPITPCQVPPPSFDTPKSGGCKAKKWLSKLACSVF